MLENLAWFIAGIPFSDSVSAIRKRMSHKKNLTKKISKFFLPFINEKKSCKKIILKSSETYAQFSFSEQKNKKFEIFFTILFSSKNRL